jgi:hypothetical protein
MQLGTRWPAGATPPSSLPDSLRAAIANVESTTPTQEHNGNALYWTLTWLENRPICRFDTGVTLVVDREGNINQEDGSGSESANDVDDWLG